LLSRYLDLRQAAKRQISFAEPITLETRASSLGKRKPELAPESATFSGLLPCWGRAAGEETTRYAQNNHLPDISQITMVELKH
jgi:hypothetical protein